MAYYGFDTHKEYIEIASVEKPSGSVIKRFRLKTDNASLKGFAAKLSSKDSVVIESTSHACLIAEIIRSSGARVVLANPLKTKIIGESKVKTDKIDAEALARMLAADYIPAVWEPDEQLQQLRKLVSFACSLTKQKTMIKNRIHSILYRNIIEYNGYSDLFGAQGRAFLESTKLPEDERFQLDQLIVLLDHLESRISAVQTKIAQKAIIDKEVIRLMTIPGIHFHTALSLKAAIGDITRFNCSKKLVSYIGLHPSIYQTGHTCYKGSITKQGRSHARWLIIQVSHTIIRMPGPLRAFFVRLRKRKCYNKAIVAVAAKLLRIIWNMLTKNEDYYFSPPLRTNEKLAKLRIIATGIKLPSSKQKGQPSKGGKKVYRENKSHDHDKAHYAENIYEKFVKDRIPLDI
jgi:transposase